MLPVEWGCSHLPEPQQATFSRQPAANLLARCWSALRAPGFASEGYSLASALPAIQQSSEQAHDNVPQCLQPASLAWQSWDDVIIIAPYSHIIWTIEPDFQTPWAHKSFNQVIYTDTVHRSNQRAYQEPIPISHISQNICLFSSSIHFIDSASIVPKKNLPTWHLASASFSSSHPLQYARSCTNIQYINSCKLQLPQLPASFLQNVTLHAYIHTYPGTEQTRRNFLTTT